MIRPSKHSHPDKTLIFAAFLLLRKLKQRRVETYVDLASYIKEQCGGDLNLFVPALNLLFALGLVNYRAKNDSFEYVGPE